MNDIKLSIVIPVYNAAVHLPGLFGMLAAQTDRRFEAVLVNDGSTDESLALMRVAAENTELNIVIITQPNSGVSAARNAGIRAASAEYITFVDADDAISEDFAEARIRHADCGLCVYPHSRTVNAAPVFEKRGGNVEEKTGETMLRALLSEPTLFGVYDLVIRRDLLVNADIRFAEGWKYYEDYDFILRVFNVCKSAKYVDLCNYCYKAAEGSAMNVFNTERLLCLQLFDNEHSLYLKDRHEYHADFVKWFSARIKWSVMWQACVAMPLREARAFGKKHGMNAAMRSLLDYPDRRVSLSAAAYLVCPWAYALIMRRMGRRRTLIPDDSEQ
ncbi:MAG: glycosyltransferase [Clostridia bacterium]|nr:glycosyltransferase [Clostridia bacterium]